MEGEVGMWKGEGDVWRVRVICRGGGWCVEGEGEVWKDEGDVWKGEGVWKDEGNMMYRGVG